MKDKTNLVARIIALCRNDEPSCAPPSCPRKKDRLVVWVTVGLLSLFCVAFVSALWRDDSDLLNKILPPLIAFITLALNRLFEEDCEDGDNSSAKD